MEEKQLIAEFKTKLLSTNRRGSVFYNSFNSISNSVDLQFLANNNIVNKNENNVIAEKGKIIIDFRTNEEIRKFNASKIVRIIKKAKELLSEKNVDSLFIGKYFIWGSQSNFDKDFFRAPLILQKINLEKANTFLFSFDLTDEYLINNSLLNTLAIKNNIKWEFEEYDHNNFDSYESAITYLTKLLDKTGMKLNLDDSDFSKTYKREFSEALSENTKNVEFNNFLDNHKTGVFAYALDICALGLFDLTSNNIYSAYEYLENDIEFFSKLVTENYDALAKPNVIKKDSQIKTVSQIDFSQKNAIYNALKESTYIEGPPGTGKSQTIVNLIANIMYNDNRSIFVTEKKVASDVVYDKLKKLNDFVLAIHNNKDAREIQQKIKKMVYRVKDIVTNNQVLHQEPDTISQSIDEILDKFNEYKELMSSSQGEKYYFASKYIHKYKVTNQVAIEAEEFRIIEDNYQNLIVSSTFLKDIKELKSKIDVNFLYTEFWLEMINWNENSLKWLYNWYFKNKISKKVFLFSKWKIKKLNKHEKFLEFKKNLKKFRNSYPGTNFINIYKLFSTNISLLERDNLVKAYVYGFENEHIDLIQFANSNWETRLHELMKNKSDYDIDLIYNTMLKRIVERVLVGRYLDGSGAERPLSHLFNSLIKKIENTGNIRLKTWFKNFYPLIELMFPILFMSPETSADYKLIPLSDGHNEFEYCIFDEASQIFVEKCLPALYRAKIHVICGDDKQLPPTNFFVSRNEIENEIDDEVLLEDEEIVQFSNYRSLIDFAKGRYRKFLLKFHYRSRYEELIQFSNYKYYNGELNVVSEPSANFKPIEVINVNGRKVNGINIEEAQAAVDLTENLLKKYPDKSIGIVTFNVRQQNYIDQLIESRALKSPEIAKAYNGLSNDEKIFVKNIENVQGDERDIIIFSINFAYDENNFFRNNFGPLNNEGGEKRLNVAISRAKEKMYVIKSINSDIINANPKKLGAVHFKEFLNYCEILSSSIKFSSEHVQSILNIDIYKENDEPKSLKFDSLFEEEVYNELRKYLPQHLKLETQVESSKFKIDLAILNTQTNTYILGIECDGWTFHSSPYDRQRDIERQIFLEQRGWKIIRILSTNWWNNPSAKQQFIDEVKNIINN